MHEPLEHAQLATSWKVTVVPASDGLAVFSFPAVVVVYLMLRIVVAAWHGRLAPARPRASRYVRSYALDLSIACERAVPSP